MIESVGLSVGPPPLAAYGPSVAAASVESRRCARTSAYGAVYWVKWLSTSSIVHTHFLEDHREPGRVRIYGDHLVSPPGWYR